MVSFAIFVIFAFVGGSSGDFDICQKPYDEICNYTIMPDKFPETVDELRYACGAFKATEECFLEYEETCGDETDAATIRKIVNFLDEACEEDNPIFQALSNNIECVNQARENVYVACNMTTMPDDVKEEIYTHIQDILTEAGNDINLENAACRESYYMEVACPSITLGIHCGYKTRDAVREVMENLILSDTSKCSEDLRNEGVILYDLFETALLKEHNLRNALEEK